MSTIEGPAVGIADISRMVGEDIVSWLRGYDGYRGLIVLTDEESARGSSRSGTRGRTKRGRESRRRDARHGLVGVGMSVVAFEVYEVPVCEVVG